MALSADTARSTTRTREQTRSADEAALSIVIEAIAKAVREKDVDAMLAHCAPDIVIFDMLPPLKHQGRDAIQRLWKKTLAAFDAPVDYEVHQLELAVGEEIAFCRSLNRFGGARVGGERNVNWLCSTLGFRKLEGRWKLVHQHVSVPFDMETGKAMLDLKP